MEMKQDKVRVWGSPTPHITPPIWPVGGEQPCREEAALRLPPPSSSSQLWEALLFFVVVFLLKFSKGLPLFLRLWNRWGAFQKYLNVSITFVVFPQNCLFRRPFAEKSCPNLMKIVSWPPFSPEDRRWIPDSTKAVYLWGDVRGWGGEGRGKVRRSSSSERGEGGWAGRTWRGFPTPCPSRWGWWGEGWAGEDVNM